MKNKENTKNKKNYFTRRNLIWIALVVFYSFLIVFVGACIDSKHSIIYKKNPIALIATALNFQEISAGISGGILLILIAFYITVCFVALTYESRYATVNNIKKFSPKMIVIYLLTIISCVVLSVGVGVIIQGPLDLENLNFAFTFVWQSIILATILYVGGFLLIGSVVMLVTNYLLIDKPFKSVHENDIPDFKDDELNGHDVGYYQNGKIMYDKIYSTGLPNGKSIEYFDEIPE